MDSIQWLMSIPLTILQPPLIYRFLCVAIPVVLYFATRRFRNNHFGQGTVLAKPPRWHWLAIAILLVYLTFVFYLTGFASVWSLRVDYLHQIELNPLSILSSPATSLLNVLLFVPLGILVPLIWPAFRSFCAIAGTGFAFSALIEILQLFTTRAVTVDDLIMNTLGAVIGYALLLFVLRFRRQNSLVLPNNDTVNAFRKWDGWRILGLAALGYFLLFNWNIASWLYR